MRNSANHRRDRGSVLLLTMLLTGLLAMLASSFGSSARSQLGAAGDVKNEVHADFAVQSGLEFAQRQLLLDPDWAGTGATPVTLPGGGSFAVSASRSGEQHLLSVDGVSGSGAGEARVEATLQVDGGNSTADKALVFLGKELSLENVHINGDFILADKLGVVMDYQHSGEGGTWVPGGPASIEPFTLSWMNMNDTLFKYTDTVYVGSGSQEQKISSKVYMPAWDLNEYLGSEPGRVVLNTGGLYENVTYQDQVVFHLAPGESLTLRKCRFLGGIVVYCERSHDLRGPARNQVWIRDCTIGTGSAPHVGFIGPAVELGLAAESGEGSHVCFTNHECGQQHCCINGKKGGSQIHGFSFLHSMEYLSGLLVHGQLFVVNEMEHFSTSNIIYHNQVGLNPPPGIQTVNGSDEVRIEQLREVY